MIALLDSIEALGWSATIGLDSRGEERYWAMVWPKPGLLTAQHRAKSAEEALRAALKEAQAQ